MTDEGLARIVSNPRMAAGIRESAARHLLTRQNEAATLRFLRAVRHVNQHDNGSTVGAVVDPGKPRVPGTTAVGHPCQPTKAPTLLPLPEEFDR